MQIEITAVTIVLFISFLISGGITLYSQIKRYLKGQIWFTLAMSAASLYGFAAVIESASLTIADKVLWSKIEYIGVSFATPLILHFVVNLVNTDGWLKGKLRYFYLLSFINLLLVWTNDWHGLYWTGFEWNTSAHNILIYHHGIVYYFFAVYALTLLMLSILLLARSLSEFPDIVRKQVITLIAGCMAPFFLTLLYLTGITPVKGLDLTSMSLPLVGIIFLIGIVKFGLFKIIPSVSSRISNLIPDGIIVMDENNDIVFFNTSAATILGLKETEFSYQKMKDIKWIYDFISSENKSPRESEIMINSDPERWLEISSSELRNEADQLKGNLILLHDMTKRKQLEYQTRNILNELNISHNRMKETNSQKDRIISIIAHDLRTTFHQVINLTGIIHDMLDELSKEELNEYLGDLLKASEQGYGILEELLLWARSQKDSSSYVNIKVSNSVLQIIESMQLSLQNKQLSVSVEGNKDLEIVNDNNVLNLVLRNLIGNAIKFSETGSEITVKLEDGETYDTISVIDRGIGIPESDLPKLFNSKLKYTRTGTSGESGSGFGLLLCKEMIERNHGLIEVSSIEGQGSTFAIRFYKDHTFSLS